MIISKDSTQYIAKDANGQIYSIPSKETFLYQISEAQKVKPPTDEELLAFARQHHPYFQLTHHVTNLQNQVKEIEEFETIKTVK